MDQDVKSSQVATVSEDWDVKVVKPLDHVNYEIHVISVDKVTAEVEVKVNEKPFVNDHVMVVDVVMEEVDDVHISNFVEVMH